MPFVQDSNDAVKIVVEKYENLEKMISDNTKELTNKTLTQATIKPELSTNVTS